MGRNGRTKSLSKKSPIGDDDDDENLPQADDEAEKDDDSLPTKNIDEGVASNNDKEQAPPPKKMENNKNKNHTPVSSEEDDDDDDDDLKPAAAATPKKTKATTISTRHNQHQQKNCQQKHNNNNGQSRFFAPYRTLGIVSSGRCPFHLIPHDHSGNAMLCLAIGERFQLMTTNRLSPVLVSQAVPTVVSTVSSTILSTTSGHKGCGTSTKSRGAGAAAGSDRGAGNQDISHAVTDATLSITVVAHGSLHKPCQHVTLYHRTRPLVCRRAIAISKKQQKSSATSSSNYTPWSICDVLHMGRIKMQMASGEKKGILENAVIVVAVLSRKPRNQQEKEHTKKNKDGASDDDEVPVVGQDDDDDSESDDHDDDSNEDESSSSSSSSSSDDDSSNDSNSSSAEKDESCLGQVVVFLATRTTLEIQKRIYLNTEPNFCPRKVIHPPTYLNKIVLVGSDYINSNENQLQVAAMCLVNIRSGKMVHKFQCLKTNQSSTTSTLSLDATKKSTSGTWITAVEPSPAIDTVAVGTNQGHVYLINLRHDKKLFTLRHKAKNGKHVSISSISFRTDGSAMHYGIAPMAVGRSDGSITIWDLTASDDDDDKKNTTTGRTILCEMDNVHRGGISKLQYLPHEPLLVSVGNISNAVTIHIFDNPDHSGRILRQRRGHVSAPTRIRYLHPGTGAGGGLLANAADGTDASSCQILSAGSADRTLRIFSTARTVLDKEYSQGAGLEKRARKLGLVSTAELLLPPITAMAMSESRSRDWGDLVTLHENHSFAYVWSTKRGAQSGPLLRQPSWNVSAMKVPPPAETQATAVAMSACGNFALVGTRGGTIYKYNVQSGIPRGSYPRDAAEQDQEEGKKSSRPEAGDIKRTMRALEKKMKVSSRASNLDKRELDAEQAAKLDARRKAKLFVASHTGFSVTGIAVDAINKTVVSVGADAKLILWSFSGHTPHTKCPCKLPCAATSLYYIRDSDLTAIALEDYSVVLFDCSADSLSIVRRFGAAGSPAFHTGPISDVGFSADGRSLYTASLDSSLRVWDVPTNLCIDWLSFSSPPTSLTVSPTGEFLATTHADKLGLSIWSDRSFYQTVHSDGLHISEPYAMDDPVPLGDSGWEADDVETIEIAAAAAAGTGNSAAKDVDDADTFPVTPKESGLVTLSGLPPAHWKNLFHLELVKERNKPKEPPKKPPSAPFFLQWRSGEAVDSGDGAQPTAGDDKATTADKDAEEWTAAWSDDEDDSSQPLATNEMVDTKRTREESRNEDDLKSSNNKRKKVTHFRSHLAALLHECSNKTSSVDPGEPRRYQFVTDHVATLGPSAIDVALSTLCSGMHDLEEGLPLLQMACMWLLEACRSRERYEAVNAYLHRFLHLHAAVIADIDENFRLTKDGQEEELVVMDEEEKRSRTIQKQQRLQLVASLAELRQAQREGSEALQSKMQHALCLVRHFSRMV